MNAVTNGSHKSIGHKVIFHSRIHLDNVPTLPTDIEVMDSCTLAAQLF